MPVVMLLELDYRDYEYQAVLGCEEYCGRVRQVLYLLMWLVKMENLDRDFQSTEMAGVDLNRWTTAPARPPRSLVLEAWIPAR